MEEGKESAMHFYAKHALAKMLDEIHKNDNCFHVVEYPIIEELDTNAFDEFYSIRKKDNAVLKRPDYDDESGNYERVSRIWSQSATDMTGEPWSHFKYYIEEGGTFNPYTSETKFDNFNMPTLQNYIDGGVKVKYFVDVVQVWKGMLAQCFEIKNRNPMTAEKSDHLCWLVDDVYEIPARYILGFDIRKPNLQKLKQELMLNLKYKLYGE